MIPIRHCAHPRSRVTLLLTLLLSLLLGMSIPLRAQILAPQAVSAQSDETNSRQEPGKDEIVYVKLEDTGAVSDTYVVNRFPLENRQSHSDYGSYESVLALSPSHAFRQNSATISFDAGPGTFFYQGKLQNPKLPWNFSLSCSLDGKEISYSSLSGKSGALELTLQVSPNRDPNLASFVKQFLLQGMVTLHAESLESVEAPQGISAFEGAKQRVAFFVFPGRSQTFTIRAKGQNWSPESIQWSAVPYSLNPELDLPDAQKLAQQFAPLSEGISQLSQGMQTLHLGLIQAQKGSGLLNDGMQQLSQTGFTLENGAIQLQDGLFTLSYGASEFGDGLHQARSGAKELSEGLQQLHRELSSALDPEMLNNWMKRLEQWQKKLETLLPHLPKLDPEKLQEFRAWLLAHPEDLKEFQSLLEQWKALLKHIQDGGLLPPPPPALETSSFTQAMEEQEIASKQVESALSELEAQILSLSNQPTEKMEPSAPMATDTPATNPASLDMRALQEALQSLRATLEHENGLKTQWMQALLKAVQTLQSQREQSERAWKELTRSLKQPNWAKWESWSETWIQFLDAVQTWLETGNGLEEWIQDLESIQSDLPNLVHTGQTFLSQLQSLQEGVELLADGGSALAAGLGTLDRNFALLESGILQAALGSQKLTQGIRQYCAGIRKAATGSNELQKGLTALVQGSDPLAKGLQTLDGQTQNLAPQIQKQIEDFTHGILPLPYEPQSFVSSQNKNIHSVQFVFLLNPQTPVSEPVPIPEPESRTLWQKFLDLFRRSGS